MDRATLTQFGWVVIATVIISFLLLIATPVGKNIGTSLLNLGLRQTEELDDVYSEENISKQEGKMEDLFNDTTLLIEGFHGEHNSSFIPWNKLVEEGYIIEEKEYDEITISATDKFKELEGALVIPDNITGIATAGFANTKLTKVVCGKGIRALPARAFDYSTRLKEIILDENIESFGVSAFSGCIKLEKICIKSQAFVTFKASTFEECISLSKIYFYGTKQAFGVYMNGNQQGKTIEQVFGKKVEIICSDGTVTE